MTDDAHDDRGHHRNHETPNQKATPAWYRTLHRDWRTWLVVGLMLLAMLLYVLSMDEAVRPSGEVEPPMPAAPAL